ncbi:MAG TPA: hypothetical protein PLE64_08645, partial [Spirochaetota bacterium]|nr:hypothetical protein [Spirochaetota bacterium]
LESQRQGMCRILMIHGTIEKYTMLTIIKGLISFALYYNINANKCSIKIVTGGTLYVTVVMYINNEYGFFIKISCFMQALRATTNEC